jgi:hypothetical protein
MPQHVIRWLLPIVATLPFAHFPALESAALLRPAVAMASAAQAPPPLTAADRHRLVEAVAANVRKYYVDRQVAQTTAAALLAHEAAGDYNAVTDGQAFANILVRHLIDASRDVHFTMEYTRNTFPDFSKPPPPEDQAGYRAAMAQANCTFEKVELGPNRVGYVKLNSFPDVAACQSKAESAMAAVNHAEAIIIDLRDNRGGYPGMVVFLASYLFDHPEFMFNPRDPITEQTWTRPVAGSLLVDKPVYVLTSSKTYSGAEQFSYDLKMLKRATLVGETTGGAAHSGVLHNLDDHFAIGIPEHRAVNPFSDNDWARTGVEPDVRVKAAEALATAEKLAAARRPRR